MDERPSSVAGGFGAAGGPACWLVLRRTAGAPGLQAWASWTKKGRPVAGPPHFLAGSPDQRFENWKLRRALARPYFLRSTTRGSRVRNPAALTCGRSAGS
jgi:hypothetical protein